MNHCIFSGYLLFDPSVGYESNPSVCVFKLVTYEYTRNKRGEKKRYPTTVTFQAFDSGADAIAKLGKKGDENDRTRFSKERGDENGLCGRHHF